MEYKIGQIFEIDGIWYQFVEDNSYGCGGCVFSRFNSECANPEEDVKCAKLIREDGKSGHFVRLLPIGDVYEQGGVKWQQYKCVEKPNTEDKRVYIAHTDSEVGLIVSIRLKSSNGIERKIGEIFEYNGEWYQCVENTHFDCNRCDFYKLGCSSRHSFNACGASRMDKKIVIFKRLQKVGEPFERNGYMYQEYKTHTYPLLMSGDAKTTDNGFAVIIKKRDMEENNNAKHSNSENIGKNLKPFSLEAAKSGKPVCTRDGRNARILCYDFKQNDEYPLLVAVENIYGKECPLLYSNDGICDNYKESNCELAMLPEKKEGWVNVYTNRIGGPYTSREYAIRQRMGDCIDTVKIQWEE